MLAVLSQTQAFFQQKENLRLMVIIGTAVAIIGLILALLISRWCGEKNEKTIIQIGMCLVGLGAVTAIAGLKLQEKT
jgi:Na+/glutamate symporter